MPILKQLKLNKQYFSQTHLFNAKEVIDCAKKLNSLNFFPENLTNTNLNLNYNTHLVYEKLKDMLSELSEIDINVIFQNAGISININSNPTKSVSISFNPQNANIYINTNNLLRKRNSKRLLKQ